jgi:hypothetical protein
MRNRSQLASCKSIRLLAPLTETDEMITYIAVIDGSGGDSTEFQATDMDAAKRRARRWALEGSWGPEQDTIRVHVGAAGEGYTDTIEVIIGGV